MTHPKDTAHAALVDYVRFAEKVGGTCLGLAMSGDSHPDPDGALMGLFEETQSLAQKHKSALQAQPAQDAETGRERIAAKVGVAIANRANLPDPLITQPAQEGDTCGGCGCTFQTVFRVPNEVWSKIAPRKEDLGDYIEHQYGGVLCIPCADAAAREIGITLHFVAEEWQDQPAQDDVERRHLVARAICRSDGDCAECVVPCPMFQKYAAAALSAAASDDTVALLREAREALQEADTFITNGIEYGYIRMPDPESKDHASEVPSTVLCALQKIDNALTKLGEA